MRYNIKTLLKKVRKRHVVLILVLSVIAPIYADAVTSDNKYQPPIVIGDNDPTIQLRNYKTTPIRQQSMYVYRKSSVNYSDGYTTSTTTYPMYSSSVATMSSGVIKSYGGSYNGNSGVNTSSHTTNLNTQQPYITTPINHYPISTNRTSAVELLSSQASILADEDMDNASLTRRRIGAKPQEDGTWPGETTEDGWVWNGKEWVPAPSEVDSPIGDTPWLLMMLMVVCYVLVMVRYRSR